MHWDSLLGDGKVFDGRDGRGSQLRALALAVTRGCRGPAWLCLALLGGVLAGRAAAAEDIYVSTGEHGEVSFSDQAAPGAERVAVETAEPAAEPLAELERRIAQTLAVADSLEASRLAREQARARERAAARQARMAEARPEVIYQDRHVPTPYLYPRPYRPGYGPPKRRPGPPHGRPPEPEQPPPPAQETVSKSFPVPD